VIPKIAHFHWEGQPINWLRMAGVHTFAKLNPRWEVRLVRTPDHIRARNLPLLAHEADWTWFEVLERDGGFAMATDTVFVKPIPDEWCEGDFCGCTNGTGNIFHCCIGSIPGTEFLSRCVRGCETVPPIALDYQAMGVLMMQHTVKKMGGLGRLGRMVDMPPEALCPVGWWQPERCWAREPLPITDDTIGVTWFGGHESNREWDIPADAAIVRLAHEVIGDT